MIKETYAWCDTEGKDPEDVTYCDFCGESYVDEDFFHEHKGYHICNDCLAEKAKNADIVFDYATEEDRHIDFIQYVTDGGNWQEWALEDEYHFADWLLDLKGENNGRKYRI